MLLVGLVCEDLRDGSQGRPYGMVSVLLGDSVSGQNCSDPLLSNLSRVMSTKYEAT